METYNDIYLRVRKALKAAGIESPDMEAKYIIAHGMGRTREELLAMSKIYATDADITKKIEQLLQRRIGGEPLAYVTEQWEFYGLPFIVNKNVLIPRADTELLVSETLKLINKKLWKCRVLDICTGTGCVGLAIASKVPGCRVVMADSSEQALAVCRKNTVALNLSRNTTVIEADALSAPPPLMGAFDIIAGNPPYIPSKDIETLDRSVKDYEPLKALDGGTDGMDFFDAIASKWARTLKPGGNIAFECGIGQYEEVCYILKKNRFENIAVYKDTQGIERVITGMKT